VLIDIYRHVMTRTNDIVWCSIWCSVINMYMTLYNIWVYCKPFTTAHHCSRPIYCVKPDMTHYVEPFAMAVAYEGLETLMYFIAIYQS
jgi:hypothetical protein